MAIAAGIKQGYVATEDLRQMPVSDCWTLPAVMVRINLPANKPGEHSMCIFSQPIDAVSMTNIFARSVSPTRQILVYSMQIKSVTENAMVLALPVPLDAGEEAVRFIDLSGYCEFFADMWTGFLSSRDPEWSKFGDSLELSDTHVRPPLVVHDVGEFEASYVPDIDSWDRLDERFQLSPQTWESMPPKYRDYGFAVFKFKPTAVETTIHPMAFEFPRRDPSRVFFPTVHVHDGRYHEIAQFDHVLYMQLEQGEMERIRSSRSHRRWLRQWEASSCGDSSFKNQRRFILNRPHEVNTRGGTSPWNARRFMDIEISQGILDPDSPVYCRIIDYEVQNEDIYV